MTTRVNGILVVFQIVLITVFVVLTWAALSSGSGNGTAFSLAPLYHSGVHLGAVIGGATVVCFSFIGFDAITMYTEEAKDTRTVPRAIVLALLIGGAIFFVAAWFAQSRFPTLAGFHFTDDTLPEIAMKTGGLLFQILFVSAAVAAAVASSLASHASVSRMIYVMARNGGGRVSRTLSYIHPRFRTPATAVLLVGAVSLLAAAFTLEFVSSMINFGALIAFTVVNATVIIHFALRRREVRGWRQIVRNVVLPTVGMLLTGVLWANLHLDALSYGLVWLTIGIITLLVITRAFRKPLRVKLDEDGDAAIITREGAPSEAAR